MANKITEREIYNAMINGTIDADVMVEFATKKLAQLDKRNESAKIRAAKSAPRAMSLKLWCSAMCPRKARLVTRLPSL